MAIIRLDEIEKLPSSEFRRLGWEGILERLSSSAGGVLAISSRGQVQGVLLMPEEYTRLVTLASREAELD